jgi:hypothetical protein
VLNQRLERSEPGPQLLAWLNALKEVKRIVKAEFGGVPISKQNLSQWRRGGFQEWLARQELWAKLRDMEAFAKDLGAERDNVVADDVATVLAAHYAALMATWNGRPDAKFEAAARVLNGLCRGVVQLQRGMHRAARDNRQFIQELEEKSERLNAYCKKRLLDQVWAIRREPMVAELFGGGELGRKLAKYVIALENDVPDARLEITEEDLKKSVKPAGTSGTGEGAWKTRPDDADKPLQANDMGQKSGSGISPDQSNPVKVGQSDFLQPSDEGLGNDEAKESPPEGSSPSNPTRPTPSISPEGQGVATDGGVGTLQGAFSATAMNHTAPSNS